MAQTILVFDFGSDEQAAQRARHKIEGWKQGFRLGNKMMLKFERPDEAPLESAAAEPGEQGKPAKQAVAKRAKAAASSKSSKAEKAPAKAVKAETKNGGGRVRVMIRLFFSDHEKLTQQRWLDRIPAEEPFKNAKTEVLRQADPEFSKAAETFDLLD